MSSHALLTIDEAADVIGCPIALLLLWRVLRDGPVVLRVGIAYLYPAKALARWIAAGKPLRCDSQRLARGA